MSTETEPGKLDPTLPPQRCDARYRHAEAYPRTFARCKLRWDPMFEELPGLLNGTRPPRTIIDVGCGYGVPGAWLLDRYPGAKILGLEPQGQRVRVAAMALGEQGRVAQGRAPELPWDLAEADLALMLDMAHYLNDTDLALTLERMATQLVQGAPLIIRATIPPRRRRPWSWWLEVLRIRLAGGRGNFRTPECLAQYLTRAGFDLEQVLPSGDPGGELVWLAARAK
jgi:SAM-dependent methyltransferase